MRIDYRKHVRKPAPRRMSREGRQTLAAGLFLLGFLGLAATFGGSMLTASGPGLTFRWSGNSGLSGSGIQSGMRESDDDLRTGSILFLPEQGNVCRKRIIDNATWRIRDAGAVICDEAVSWNANSAGNRISPIARIEAIRDGFHTKK